MKRIFAATLLLVALPSLTAAADLKHGQQLHDQHCLSCHHPDVYTRPNHRINSLAGLDKGVRRCELSLGLRWFDEDIADVVGYLNKNYYKFD